MADIQLARKVDLDKKADKTQVLTNVPANAKFTDTVTTINGKSGAITKADIVALGIPATDTNTTYNNASTTEDGLMSSEDKTKLNGIAAGANKYVLPSTLPASMITGLPTKLPADGGNSATVGGFTVGVNVPANAKFTDTVHTKLSQLTNDKNFIDGVYDNSTSGLTATTIQGAIDELKSLIDGLTSSE